jgi:hypothetical protein
VEFLHLHSEENSSLYNPPSLTEKNLGFDSLHHHQGSLQKDCKPYVYNQSCNTGQGKAKGEGAKSLALEKTSRRLMMIQDQYIKDKGT